MRTLAHRSRVELEIKRSRFVAHAGRVGSLADTLDFYTSVADPQASHNCWAWRLEHQYRFNDDGEPGSTAGKPILAAIEGRGLDQAMVVVTRYFGGTKLGVGGLVRAYGSSAARSIEQAGIVDIAPTVECHVQAAFEWTGQLYSAFEALAVSKLSEQHLADGIRIRIEVEKDQLEALRTLISDTTRGEASITVAG